jgi:hypothetical protein
VALLNDTKFLGELQRDLILNRQRDVVSAVTRFLRRAYPQRLQRPQPDGGDHDAVWHDQLDLHLVAPGWRHELRRFCRRSHCHAGARVGGSTRVRASGVRVVVMGVAGCGKSAVARRLADVLGLPMREGDDFHPAGNVEPAWC